MTANTTLTLKSVFTDTRENTNFTITAHDTEKKLYILKSDKTVRKVAEKSFKELVNKGIYKAVETKQSTAKQSKIPCTVKANKTVNSEITESFKEYVAQLVKSPYSCKWEQNKKKLIILYTDKKTAKTRNITELFYKSRFDTVTAFIREAELMQNIDYDKSIADSNKERGYNFFIEKLVCAKFTESKDGIKDFIETLCKNHTATLKA